MSDDREVSTVLVERLVRLRELVGALWARAATGSHYDGRHWQGLVACSPLNEAGLLEGLPSPVPRELLEAVAALDERTRDERLHGLLHALWTIAIDNPGYVKPEWKELGHLCGLGFPKQAWLDLLPLLRALERDR